MSQRTYPGPGLAVHWDAELCIHSGECVRALPLVFRPTERPWIDTQQAAHDELRAAIDGCPSGALTYTLEGTSTMEDVAPESVGAEVTVTEDGPYLVEGDVKVVGADGSVIREGHKFFLCRCGHSNVKPFCDGSHKEFDFTDPGLGKKRSPSA